MKTGTVKPRAADRLAARHNRDKSSSPVRSAPTQARAKFTFEAIVNATRDLIQKSGVDAVTTRQIAAHAGVAVGTVYQYFPDKDAILLHISKEIMDEESFAASPLLFRLHRQSLNDMLEELFKRTVRTETRLLALGKDFYRRYSRQMQFGRVQGMGSGPRSSEQIVASATRLLQDHPEEAGETDKELAAFMIVRGVRNMLATLVEERPDLLASPSLTPMLIRVARALVDSVDRNDDQDALPGSEGKIRPDDD
ncbi:MAG: TetR/AcrR family transcriptional regulator [Proteobacteria bacterium]|nr:TetR/AcrR family transcriptional regulator [Pseudomonadota bacterium]HQR02797.1 TetR/AcrR family transcriptional regulator [Rhodocyclaceae bacterium]